MRHDHVALQQVTQLARLQRTGTDLGHGGSRETFGEEGQQVLARGGRRILCRPAGDVSQAASARHQAHTHFHQTDVAFHGDNAFAGVHRHLAATAQSQTAYGRNGWHVGVTQFEHDTLQFGRGAVNGFGAPHHKGRQHGLEIGAGREHLVGRPDHQALEVFFGQVDGGVQALDHTGTDGMHLGLDAGDQDVVVKCPQSNGLVFVQGLSGRRGRRGIGAQHTLGEMLARIHRQTAGRDKLARGGVP